VFDERPYSSIERDATTLNKPHFGPTFSWPHLIGPTDDNAALVMIEARRSQKTSLNDRARLTRKFGR